jgi:hypothetical protein
MHPAVCGTCASSFVSTSLKHFASTRASQAAGHSSSQQPLQNACAPTTMLYRRLWAARGPAACTTALCKLEIEVKYTKLVTAVTHHQLGRCKRLHRDVPWYVRLARTSAPCQRMGAFMAMAVTYREPKQVQLLCHSPRARKWHCMICHSLLKGHTQLT